MQLDPDTGTPFSGVRFQSSIWSYFLCSKRKSPVLIVKIMNFNLLFEAIFYATPTDQGDILKNVAEFQSSIWSYFLCNHFCVSVVLIVLPHFNLLFEAIFYATHIQYWNIRKGWHISIFYLKLFSMQTPFHQIFY